MFSVLHLNIRSLPKNYEKMVHFLSSLNYEFLVIALTETWLTEHSKELGLYELPSYNSTHYVGQSKSGGGVSIFVHKNLNFNVRQDFSIKLGETQVESVFIEIFSNNRSKNLIGSIYRPPNTDIVNCNQYFSSTLELINRENKVYNILGDFNINLFKKEIHSETDEVLNQLNANYFFPAITKPTRITDSSATLIDNILFNTLNCKTKSGILFTDISDHFPIFQIAELGNSYMHNKVPLSHRSYSSANKTKFKQSLKSTSFEHVFRESDPNSAYQVFMQIFKDIFEKSFPFNKCYRNRAKKQNPLFSNGLMKSS